ncbi:protein OSB3, chloroplastic/mitochondrial-like isoform X1 [Musa acuminata AAA Group]|uniref:protein OSB3, chloroplastic/mitochondrial-like isoform X1 n=1 Tax=Musa acuminata AAA Group TaxID=214697 RepID=UPI0031D38D4D
MNLSRAITRVLSSHCRRSNKWLSLHQFPFAAFQLAYLSADSVAPAKRTYRRTAKPKPEADPLGPVATSPAFASREEESLDPRCPSEIPFQSKVANQVHLIGTVGVPVELQALPNGAYTAVSILASEKTKGFHQFWIPVKFQGDLAQVAACHLKVNDVIYVTGQLSGDAPPHAIEDAHTKLQVLAHSLNFVQSKYSDKADDNINEKDEPSLDLGKRHWDGHQRQHMAIVFNNHKSVKKMEKSAENLWDDLVLNPHNWLDNRLAKKKGSLHPNFPDFKHSETQKALWLNDAPSWVSAKLDGLVFRTTRMGEKSDGELPAQQKENSWKSLVDNPNDWWDNRANKFNQKSPDFKHKKTGEALWLSSTTPQWVLTSLPPVNTEKKFES